MFATYVTSNNRGYLSLLRNKNQQNRYSKQAENLQIIKQQNAARCRQDKYL